MKNKANTSVFEQAMNARAFKVYRIFYKNGTRFVREVHGRVPVAIRTFINGERKTITSWKRRRWDEEGRCFSIYSQKRYRNFDINIKNV